MTSGGVLGTAVAVEEGEGEGEGGGVTVQAAAPTRTETERLRGSVLGLPGATGAREEEEEEEEEGTAARLESRPGDLRAAAAPAASVQVAVVEEWERRDSDARITTV